MRRPAGWIAPGPRPAGPRDRSDLVPGPGEDLCALSGDWRIFQRQDGHRFSLDDVATAWYATEKSEGRSIRIAADIGCGIGSVLLMVAWRFPDANVVGVEAQEVSVDLARRSLAYNGAETRCTVHLADLRDARAFPDGAAFDLVTGTPPYFPIGNGTVSDRVQCGPCRFESRGGIEDYCDTAARLLAPHGLFAVCFDARAPDRVASAARRAGLAILSSRNVVPRERSAPLITLYAMTRATEDLRADAGRRTIEPSLVVRDAAGQWTPDFLALRAAMGFPPRPAPRQRRRPLMTPEPSLGEPVP